MRTFSTGRLFQNQIDVLKSLQYKTKWICTVDSVVLTIWNGWFYFHGLNGFATCLRLEEVYWEVLADISHINNCSINTLLSYIDLEVHLRHGGVKNFSGFIRVVCVMHLLKRARGPQGMAQQVFVGWTRWRVEAVWSMACNRPIFMIHLGASGCSCGCNGSIYQI